MALLSHTSLSFALPGTGFVQNLAKVALNLGESPNRGCRCWRTVVNSGWDAHALPQPIPNRLVVEIPGLSRPVYRLRMRVHGLSKCSSGPLEAWTEVLPTWPPDFSTCVACSVSSLKSRRLTNLTGAPTDTWRDSRPRPPASAARQTSNRQHSQARITAVLQMRKAST